MTLPTINPCRLTGSPAVLQTRAEFHREDTLEKHLDRYGLSPRAIGVFAEAAAFAYDFNKEDHPESSRGMEDFRVTATVGQNATGWKHAIHPEEVMPGPGEKKAKDMGFNPAMLAAQREQAIEECVKEWNTANPLKG